jgi:hypothetical protein
MLGCLQKAAVGSGSRVFARDDKNFARDDKRFARNDKRFARDDKRFSRDDIPLVRDDKNIDVLTSTGRINQPTPFRTPTSAYRSSAAQ